MRKALAIILLLATLNSLCSCGQSSIPDTIDYIPGQDMQYFQLTECEKTALMQETENGCYFYHDRFIYYYDNKTGQIDPLCSRPGCLHEKETDLNKKQECCAYLDSMRYTTRKTMLELPVSLMLYKENLYVCYELSFSAENAGESPCAVVRIACDGSSKDRIYEDNRMMYSMIHRGYLYYYAIEYPIDEKTGEVRVNNCLYRINLEGSIKKELIFKPDPATPDNMGYIRGYGNYILFDTNERALTVDDTDLHYGLYNIHTGETVFVDELCMHPTCYNKKLYFRNPGGNYDYYAQVPLEYADLDGTDRGIALEEITEGTYLMADGKYLYINYGASLRIQFYDDRKIEDEEVLFEAYDKDMNLIDEFNIPRTNWTMMDPPIGGEKYLYLPFEDIETGEWGLLVWDKSEIGTLHRKTVSAAKVLGQ